MYEYRRYNYRKRNYTSNKPTEYDIVPYLVCNDKPLSLINVSVKNIISDHEYSKLVRDCKRKSKNNCDLCGRYVKRTLDDFIHPQELLSMDFSSKVAKFKGLVGLCKDCYYMFNPYLLEKDIDSYVVNSKYASRVIRKRLSLLRYLGLETFNPPKSQVWVLEYKGYKYMNDSLQWVLERALNAGVRILPMKKDFRVMLEDCYYHKPFS